MLRDIDHFDIGSETAFDAEVVKDYLSRGKPEGDAH